VGLLKLSEMLGSVSEDRKGWHIPETAFTASRSYKTRVPSWRCARSTDANLARRTGSRNMSSHNYLSYFLFGTTAGDNVTGSAVPEPGSTAFLTR
jgi:hypothetical protein